MRDLISRQAAIDYLMTNMIWYDEDGYEADEDEKHEAITELINGVPDADTDLSAYSDKLWRAAYERGKKEAEAERKRGKWTKDNGCPFCGFHPWFERDIHTLSFCPNCGADMRGGDEDE